MVKKIGLFLEFDNVITQTSSNNETFKPFGLEEKYLENIKKILDDDGEYSIKSFLKNNFDNKFSYGGCHIVSMSKYSKIKEITDELCPYFDSITGSLEDIDFFAEYSKDPNEIRIRFTDGNFTGYKIFDIRDHNDINTCQLWSNVKHEIIKSIIDSNDIDYALVIDYDDIYNGYLYGIASEVKYGDYGVKIKNTNYYYYGKHQNDDNNFLLENIKKLVPNSDCYIYDDPKIIHLDIGFINYYFLNKPGVFHNIKHFYYQIKKLDLIIKIKQLYTLYIYEEKIDDNVLLNLSYLLGNYRIYNRCIKKEILNDEYFYNNIIFFDIIHSDTKIDKLSFIIEIIMDYINIISIIFDGDYNVGPDFICDYALDNSHISFDDLLIIYKKFSENNDLDNIKNISKKYIKLSKLYEKNKDDSIKKEMESINEYFKKERENIYKKTEDKIKKEKIAIFSGYFLKKTLEYDNLFGVYIPSIEENKLEYEQKPEEKLLKIMPKSSKLLKPSKPSKLLKPSKSPEIKKQKESKYSNKDDHNNYYDDHVFSYENPINRIH